MWTYNEHDTLTFRHKITLNELTCHFNQSINLFLCSFSFLYLTLFSFSFLSSISILSFFSLESLSPLYSLFFLCSLFLSIFSLFLHFYTLFLFYHLLFILQLTVNSNPENRTLYFYNALAFLSRNHDSWFCSDHYDFTITIVCKVSFSYVSANISVLSGATFWSILRNFCWLLS